MIFLARSLLPVHHLRSTTEHQSLLIQQKNIKDNFLLKKSIIVSIGSAEFEQVNIFELCY